MAGVPAVLHAFGVGEAAAIPVVVMDMFCTICVIRMPPTVTQVLSLGEKFIMRPRENHPWWLFHATVNKYFIF